MDDSTVGGLVFLVCCTIITFVTHGIPILIDRKIEKQRKIQRERDLGRRKKSKAELNELRIQLALGSLSKNALEVVANNPTIPTDILETLSTDKNWEVRYQIAQNPSTPAVIRLKLCDDVNWQVRGQAEWLKGY